jgi:ribonuclease HI
MCGEGGVIYLNDQRVITFKVGLCKGTNNLAELMALKPLLILSAKEGVPNIQISGDSLVVVNWMNGTYSLETYSLRPIYEKKQLAQTAFDSISFQHVYREKNVEADGFQKLEFT